MMQSTLMPQTNHNTYNFRGHCQRTRTSSKVNYSHTAKYRKAHNSTI